MISNNQNNSFYRGIWNSLPHPGFIINSHLKIVDANSLSEDFCLTGKKRIIGRLITEFIGDSSLLIKVIQQTVKEKSPVTVYSIDMFLAGRGAGVNNVYCSPLETLDDFVLLLIQPTNQNNKMDRNLLHQNAARSVSGLAAMLGHEIKNPLAGISGAAQLLAQNANQEDFKFTELIQSEIKRIANLVSKFEIFGDIGPLRKSSMNIHDVLEKTKELAKAGFASHVRFYEDYDPSLPNINGHFDQLTQVFLNILKNSAEALPTAGGFIKIITSYRSGIKILNMNNSVINLPISISITDNGKGVSSEIVNKIFEPFISTKKVGSGLGLALVSKIIADHGGCIDCSSENGKTVFNICLPLGEKDLPKLENYEIHSRLLSKTNKN